MTIGGCAFFYQKDVTDFLKTRHAYISKAEYSHAFCAAGV